jgi:hypothetical protein
MMLLPIKSAPHSVALCLGARLKKLIKTPFLSTGFFKDKRWCRRWLAVRSHEKNNWQLTKKR